MLAQIPILTYHALDDSGSVISIAPAMFRRQMAFLAKRGYQTLTLSEAIRYLVSGIANPGQYVVLTFDDGYQSVYTEAFPVLAEFGFVATVFPITAYCGKEIGWTGPTVHPGSLALIDWPEIKEMHAYGFEFGAHTLTHPDLSLLSAKDAEYEMLASKAALQDRLGTEVEGFAYPFGSYNSRVRTTASHFFDYAVSTNLGKARSTDDLHELHRLDMYYFQSWRLFRAFDSKVIEPYLRVRQALRDTKKIMEASRPRPPATLIAA